MLDMLNTCIRKDCLRPFNGTGLVCPECLAEGDKRLNGAIDGKRESSATVARGAVQDVRPNRQGSSGVHRADDVHLAVADGDVQDVPRKRLGTRKVNTGGDAAGGERKLPKPVGGESRHPETGTTATGAGKPTGPRQRRVQDCDAPAPQLPKSICDVLGLCEQCERLGRCYRAGIPSKAGAPDDLEGEITISRPCGFCPGCLSNPPRCTTFDSVSLTPEVKLKHQRSEVTLHDLLLYEAMSCRCRLGQITDPSDCPVHATESIPSKKGLESRRSPEVPDPSQSSVVGENSNLGAKRTASRMNKTEQRYALILEARKRAGEITDYAFEAISFAVGLERCTYRPDFIAWGPDTLEAIEVKGGFMREDSRVKFQSAAKQYPWLRWKLVKWIKGEWITVYDWE